MNYMIDTLRNEIRAKENEIKILKYEIDSKDRLIKEVILLLESLTKPQAE